MSDERSSLTNALQDAVATWCAENDKSMMVNFVFVAEFIEEDGCRSSAVVSPESSSLSGSLGLAHYAVNMFNEMQRRDLLEFIYTDDELGED